MSDFERTRIVVPFSDEQVIQLNSWQANQPFHPFTCGGDHESHVNLVATRDGWVCPDPQCDYTQDWAHDFMGRWVETIGKDRWGFNAAGVAAPEGDDT